MEAPEELKFCNNFLLRAKEIKDKDAVVAYYCRLYAVKLAVEKGAKSKESQTFLLSLMDQLEKVHSELIPRTN